MVRAGYMYKRVVSVPDRVKVSAAGIYSVSGCISACFADYIRYWRHNGFWFFDSPRLVQSLAAEQSIELSGSTPFYYEVFEEQYDQANRCWVPFGPAPSFATHVEHPVAARLEGYDVVTFSAQTSPECSPLSCNSLAARTRVNPHCLFDSFDLARQSLEQGLFDDSEPGPFRIFAVHTLGAQPR